MFVNKTFGDRRFFENDSESSHSLWLESGYSIKHVTRVDSSQHRFFVWLESSH